MKRLVFKLLGFCGAYLVGLLLFQWAPVENTCSRFFAKGGGWVLENLLPKGYFQTNSEARQGGATIRVVFGNKQTVAQQVATAQRNRQAEASLTLKEFRVKSREFFLIPLVFFLALVTITPDTWRAKGRLLGWGLPVLLLFFWIKLFFYTLYHFNTQHLGVYEGDSLSAQTAAVFYNLKVGVNFVFAALVWFWLAFGRSDWKKMLTNF